MEPNKNTGNNNPNSQNRNFNEGGSSSNGGHYNYNKKKKQRHFGPTQPGSTPGASNPAAAQPNPGVSANNPNTPNPARANTSNQQGVSAGNNPPRPKNPNQQNNPNQQRNQNAPYSSTQQPRPQSHQPANVQGAGNRNATQAPVSQPNVQTQAQRNDRPNRKWENRMVKIEETYEDIKKDNERIEKEIWLEIAEIHNAKLD